MFVTSGCRRGRKEGSKGIRKEVRKGGTEPTVSLPWQPSGLRHTKIDDLPDVHQWWFEGEEPIVLLYSQPMLFDVEPDSLHDSQFAHFDGHAAHRTTTPCRPVANW